MTSRARWMLVVAVALALPACGGGSLDPVGRKRLEITGGSRETGYLAVFALAYDGVGGCSGTCISPHVGLTAAHCVEGEVASTLSGLFGDSEYDPERTIQVTELAEAPAGVDIAMLAFAEACPATIAANHVALEDHLAEPVVMVGFGVTTESAEDAGIKRSGTATLFSVDPAEVNGLDAGELATSNDPAGTCNGDSGGPTFMTLGGEEVVVGVTSRGSLDESGRDEPCGQGRSIAVRADSHAAFLDDFVARHDDVGDPDPDDDRYTPAGDDPAEETEDPEETDDPEADPGADPAPYRAPARTCQAGGPAAGAVGAWSFAPLGLALLAGLLRPGALRRSSGSPMSGRRCPSR